MYSFDSKVTHGGYYVFHNYTWQIAKLGHKLKVERETNKSKHQLFHTWLTLGHILSEISRHCYLYMEGSGNITAHLIYTTYTVSPIPAGDLEVPLLLKFSISERIFKLMKSFFNHLYDYKCTGMQAEKNEEESGNKEKVDINGKNAINENNKNVMYPFLFQVVLDLKKKSFSLIIFPKLVSKKWLFR